MAVCPNCGFNTPTEDPGKCMAEDPIPRYAQQDIWMSLYGAENSEGYDEYRERYGFAETWAMMCSVVRLRSNQ